MVEKKCTMVLYCPVHGKAFKGRELPLNWRNRRCDTCQTHLMILDIDCNPSVYLALGHEWEQAKPHYLSLPNRLQELQPLRSDRLGCRVAGVLLKAYAASHLQSPLQDLADEDVLGLPHFGLKMLARLRQQVPGRKETNIVG